MNRKAFTFTELLIIISLISIFFVGVIVAINPIAIINRGYDSARKKDLDDAKKMLEQYMTDTGCYPQPTQICIEGKNNSNCHICTKKQSPKFSYFTKDICDPKAGQMDYLYQVDTTMVYKVGQVVSACPKWFRLYSVLNSAYDKANDVWGCGNGGCGVSPSYGYSYLVTSPGAPVDGIISSTWFCYLDINNACNPCGTYDNCNLPTNDCQGKELFPTKQNCCSTHSISPCL